MGTKLWAFKYDNDIRIQLRVDTIMKELIQSCTMYPKRIKGVWVAYSPSSLRRGCGQGATLTVWVCMVK